VSQSSTNINVANYETIPQLFAATLIVQSVVL
jgi:hypothetical protein